mmetsp:Transcript_89092/g.251457  ORF Transcript_89092/g.251457 Transcript_89092/m.251457 type:complete len:210 (-) Transcript_89092:353-982(-)
MVGNAVLGAHLLLFRVVGHVVHLRRAVGLAHPGPHRFGPRPRRLQRPGPSRPRRPRGRLPGAAAAPRLGALLRRWACSLPVGFHAARMGPEALPVARIVGTRHRLWWYLGSRARSLAGVFPGERPRHGVRSALPVCGHRLHGIQSHGGALRRLRRSALLPRVVPCGGALEHDLRGLVDKARFPAGPGKLRSGNLAPPRACDESCSRRSG